MRRLLLSFILICLLTIPASAHPGGVDQFGGHDDSDGSYHYHHGYPAHDHTDLDGDGREEMLLKVEDGSGFGTFTLCAQDAGGTVTVKPYVYAHDFAQGEVLSPAGKIFVSWRRQGSRFTLTVKAPTPVSVALPDGTVHTQAEGTWSCEIS